MQRHVLTLSLLAFSPVLGVGAGARTSDETLTTIDFPDAVVGETAGIRVRGEIHDDDHDGRRGCSNRTLRGSYGFTRRGTHFGRGVFAAVGIVTFDGNGNASGAETAVFEDTGTVRSSFTASYAVSSSCRGEWLGGDIPLGTIVVVDHGKEIRLVEERTDRIATAIFKAQGRTEHDDHDGDDDSAKCTNAVLSGPYGWTLEGKQFTGDPGFLGVRAGVGTTTFDGAGTFALVGTTVFEFQGSRHLEFSGEYTINPDCTGSSIAGPLRGEADFVIVNRGKEIMLITTGHLDDAIAVVTYNYRKY